MNVTDITLRISSEVLRPFPNTHHRRLFTPADFLPTLFNGSSHFFTYKQLSTSLAILFIDMWLSIHCVTLNINYRKF